MKVVRIVQVARNAVLIIFSAAMAKPASEQLGIEPVFSVILGFIAAFAVLTIAEFVLMAAKIKSKAYYYFNAIVQIPAGFILTGLGGFGLLGIPGIILLVTNPAIIILLRRDAPKISKK